MENSAPEAVLAADFKLALKTFMNKEFDRSFPLILRLCEQAFINYRKGYLGEDLFVNIVELYLTEVGVVLPSKETHGVFVLAKREKQSLVQGLIQGKIMAKLSGQFGSVGQIPPRLLYQVHLVYLACEHLLSAEKPDFVLRQYESVYEVLEFTVNDAYLCRFVETFVCNVLPAAEQWMRAYKIAETNPLLNKESIVAKLKELEAVAQEEMKRKDQKKSERRLREEKFAELEREKQRKELEEKSLRYKSLKQIKRELAAENDELRSDALARSGLAADIKHKIAYYYKLTQAHVQKNMPVLAAALALLLVFLRVVNVRQINLRDKIRETLLMALKVTYM